MNDEALYTQLLAAFAALDPDYVRPFADWEFPCGWDERDALI